MKTPSFFKLSTEAVKHLEAAISFFNNSGHKTNKTELVERSIFSLPTSEDQKLDSSRKKSANLVPPLLAAYRAWRGDDLLELNQIQYLVEHANSAVRQHKGHFKKELLVDCLLAFKAVRGLRPNVASIKANDLDKYYISNLVERSQGGLMASIDATITRILDPNFAGSPDFPVRNLLVAVRDEVLNVTDLNEAISPYFRSLFLLAIRGHVVESGQIFLDPESKSPDAGQYWGEHYKTGKIEFSPFELSWGFDHSTLGGRLELLGDDYKLCIQLSTYISFCDFFYLLRDVSNGGLGGNRGEFCIERVIEDDGSSGLLLEIGVKDAKSTLTVGKVALSKLESLTKSVFEDEQLKMAFNKLVFIYGDI